MKTKDKQLRQRFWFCLLLNVLICVLFALVTAPFYEVNDDYVMTHLVDGSAGYTDPHLVFSNTILGWILVALYSICRIVPWYTLLQYLCICLGFACVTWVIQKRSEKQLRGWLMNVLLWIYFGYECYTRIQFTKTAAIAGVSGMLVLYDALLPAGTDLRDIYRFGVRVKPVKKGSSRYLTTPEKGAEMPAISWLQVAGGIAVALFGSMYRVRQFLPCAVLTSGIGISLLFALRPYQNRIRLRLLGRYAAVMGLVFGVTIGAAALDHVAYQSNEEWGYHRQYNMLRARLLDYYMMDYAPNKEALDAAGIDYTAYKLICGTSVADPETFNIEAMKAMKKMMPEHVYFDKGILRAYFKDLLPSMINIRTFFVFASFFLIWLLSRRHGLADLAGALWSVAAFLALYYYLFANGRYLANRVDTGLWYAMSIVFLWFILIQPEGKYSFVKPILIGTAMFASMVMYEGDGFAPTYRWTQEAKNRKEAQAKQQKRMEKVSEDKDHLYLAMMGTISDSRCSDPFHTLPKDYFSNVIWSGGWETYTARFNRVLEEYDITNPFRALVETDRVYLVAYKSDLELITDYLQRYGKNVSPRKVRSIKKSQGLNVYTFDSTS